MKKTILISAIFILLFGLTQNTLAQQAKSSGFVPLAPITGLTDTGTANSVADSGSLAIFFNNLYKLLVGIAATLAVIEIIWGGLEYSTQDSISKKTDGKHRIFQAIFGLILVLSPVIVFSIINPRILNLSLSLPKLDLTTENSFESGSGVGGTGGGGF